MMRFFESCDSVQWQNGHNQKREKRCFFLTRSHCSMVLYLKSVFYIGSRETGMWAGQRWGKELPAEHSLSQLLFCVSFADERDRVQKKTFTKWVNKHLMKVGFFHVSLAFLILCVCAHAHVFCMCMGSYTCLSHGIDVRNDSRFIFHFIH